MKKYGMAPGILNEEMRNGTWCDCNELIAAM